MVSEAVSKAVSNLHPVTDSAQLKPKIQITPLVQDKSNLKLDQKNPATEPPVRRPPVSVFIVVQL